MGENVTNKPLIYSRDIRLITQIIRQNKDRKKRITILRQRGYKVVEGGYMRNATKIGDSEYFPKKKQVRVVVSRPSVHYYRQFDYIVFNVR